LAAFSLATETIRETTPMSQDARQAARAAILRAGSGWAHFLAALLLAMTLFCGTSAAQSQAGNRDFTLQNLTRFDIDSVSTSTADSDVWTVLRNSSVKSGGSADFSFDNVGECVLQLRIDLTDGRYVAWTDGFDFCNLNTLTITYNGNNDTFNARAQ
jgi:hypothetical protein